MLEIKVLKSLRETVDMMKKIPMIDNDNDIGDTHRVNHYKMVGEKMVRVGEFLKNINVEVKK